MRSLMTFLAALSLSTTAAAADVDQLVCGLTKGMSATQRTVEIKRGYLGNGSYTEYTVLKLKLKGLKMEATQIFEKINIEVTDAMGKSLLRIDGENKVVVGLRTDDAKNSIAAACAVNRKAK